MYTCIACVHIHTYKHTYIHTPTGTHQTPVFASKNIRHTSIYTRSEIRLETCRHTLKDARLETRLKTHQTPVSASKNIREAAPDVCASVAARPPAPSPTCVAAMTSVSTSHESLVTSTSHASQQHRRLYRQLLVNGYWSLATGH